MCVGICLALRLDGLDDDRAGLRAALRRRLPGGPDLGGGDRGGPLRRPQPDRDRRLQPPADRRHHRGGHGHRRRARQVRGLRLGRGRDRRPRHAAGRRGAGAQPHARKPAAIVAQTKKGKGVSSMEGRFGFHGKPPSPEQAAEALEELMATLDEQTKALHEAERRGRRQADGGRGQDRADRDPPRLRRRAGRARRAPRRRRRARRRPRRLHPVDQVRQALSRSASSTSARPRRT